MEFAKSHHTYNTHHIYNKIKYPVIFDTVIAEESSGGDSDTEFFGESSSSKKHVAKHINVKFLTLSFSQFCVLSNIFKIYIIIRKKLDELYGVQQMKDVYFFGMD